MVQYMMRRRSGMSSSCWSWSWSSSSWSYSCWWCVVMVVTTLVVLLLDDIVVDIVVVNGYMTGSGGCDDDGPSVGMTHLINPKTGSLEDHGGLHLYLDDDIEFTTTTATNPPIINFTINVEHKITLTSIPRITTITTEEKEVEEGDDGEDTTTTTTSSSSSTMSSSTTTTYKGVLFRLHATDGRANAQDSLIVIPTTTTDDEDDVDSSSSDNSISTNKNMYQDASFVCDTSIDNDNHTTTSGITHTNNQEKSTTEILLYMEEESYNMTLQVTVVIENRISSEFYYTKYYLNAIQNNDDDDHDHNNNNNSMEEEEEEEEDHDDGDETVGQGGQQQQDEEDEESFAIQSDEPTPTMIPTITQIPSLLPYSVIELIQDQDDLSLLQKALQDTGLEDDIRAIPAVTIFAPIDIAYERDLEPKFWKPDWILHMEALIGLHTGHTIIVKPELTDGVMIDTYYQGETLLVSVDDDDDGNNHNNITLNGKFGTSTIIETDDLFAATNGVVHKINKLMLPSIFRSDVLQGLESTSAFNIFLQLIALSGLEEQLRTDNVTLLAPLDDVFNQDDDEQDSNDFYRYLLEYLSDPNNIDILREFISYHVIWGPNIYPSTELQNEPTLENAAGVQLNVSFTFPQQDDDEDGEQRATFNNIISTRAMNGLAYNGVAHAMGGIFLPSGLDIADIMPSSYIPSSTPTEGTTSLSPTIINNIWNGIGSTTNPSFTTADNNPIIQQQQQNLPTMAPTTTSLVDSETNDDNNNDDDDGQDNVASSSNGDHQQPGSSSSSSAASATTFLDSRQLISKSHIMNGIVGILLFFQSSLSFNNE